MNKNDLLEQIFAGYQPDLGDSGEFMAALERRLEAVEYIRQMQEAQVRRYRMMVVAALVAGLVLGGGLTAVVLMLPDSVPSLTWVLPGLTLHIPSEAVRLATICVVAPLLGLANVAGVWAAAPSPASPRGGVDAIV